MVATIRIKMQMLNFDSMIIMNWTKLDQFRWIVIGILSSKILLDRSQRLQFHSIEMDRMIVLSTRLLHKVTLREFTPHSADDAFETSNCSDGNPHWNRRIMWRKNKNVSILNCRFSEKCRERDAHASSPFLVHPSTFFTCPNETNRR